MAVRIDISRIGIELLKREPSMHIAIGEIARRVAVTATGIAPHRTGHYEASVTSTMIGSADAMSRVYARDFKWGWIEYGAGPSPFRGGRPFPAHHPLRNAVLLNGLRYIERWHP